jgi:hypothetical protein
VSQRHSDRPAIVRGGVAYYEGDVVRLSEHRIAPNWDGWGRDLPNPGPPTYYDTVEEGVIRFNQERGEYRLVDPIGRQFPLYDMQRIELVSRPGRPSPRSMGEAIEDGWRPR